jgi:hypothetical protein
LRLRCVAHRKLYVLSLLIRTRQCLSYTTCGSFVGVARYIGVIRRVSFSMWALLGSEYEYSHFKGGGKTGTNTMIPLHHGKDGEKGSTCSTDTRYERCHARFCFEKHARKKKPYGAPRRRWLANIQKGLRSVLCVISEFCRAADDNCAPLGYCSGLQETHATVCNVYIWLAAGFRGGLL